MVVAHREPLGRVRLDAAEVLGDAFGLARVPGHDVLRGVFGNSADAGLLGPQFAFPAAAWTKGPKGTGFFDRISHAVGLSRLHGWRFAPATMAGIVPASFLLRAHFGGEAVSGNLGRATGSMLALGLGTGLPLLWAAIRKKPEKGNPRRKAATRRTASSCRARWPWALA